MKIALVSPLYESVPPRFYGGTERVVSFLTEELVDRGHEVTLFASGDSVTRARLIAPCPRSLRLNPGYKDGLAQHFVLLEEVFRRASQFDIIHFNIDYLHFPLSRRQTVPHLTTLHGRLDIPDLIPLYREYADIPVVSISQSQRAPIPWANWQGTIPHGLPSGLYRAGEGKGGYLAFLGRISPEKGVDRAVKIALRSGIPLKIAAKADPADHDYFESLKPLFQHSLVEFVGEIGESEKETFLGDALALLFPIDWQEPFGLVMIESLACGTPVIAWPLGSVPEVIEDGVTGYLVQDVQSAVRAIGSISTLSRLRCRAEFERRFSASRMAADYIALFDGLCQRGTTATQNTHEEAETRRPYAGGHSGQRPVLHTGDVFPGVGPQPGP